MVYSVLKYPSVDVITSCSGQLVMKLPAASLLEVAINGNFLSLHD
jgi:hypothetical protein